MGNLFSDLSPKRRVKKFLTRFLDKYVEQHKPDISSHLRWRALDSTCEYVEKNMVGARLYPNRLEAMNHALSAVSLEGTYSEFGVYKGQSVNHIARSTKKEVHAFDSFAGLPENWLSSHQAGHFAVDELPVFEKNVVVHQGLFADTLPVFLKENGQKAAFIHIDCDLYSSTKTVFDLMGDRIVENTIIIFDEYFNYPFWQHHEYKAFQEFVRERGMQYQYLGYTSRGFGCKVAVKILRRK